jgi:hypothetical protein
MGSLSPTASTSPSYPQGHNYGVNTLVATPTLTYYLYLPLVLRNFTPLINGDFETCGFTGWQRGQGPFSGRGSGLPQTVVSFEGSCRGRLGDPSAQNGAIPVGYGYLAQTFTVNDRYLRLRYRILTRDIIRGNDGYNDTFEVSLNTPPNQISDGERNSRGCDMALLNPTNTINPSEGLVFCGGHKGPAADVGVLRDLGWQKAILDLQQFQDKNITLYFALWSREYVPPYYDNRGFYNTWAYIDDVQLAPAPCPYQADNDMNTIKRLIEAEAEAVNIENISIIHDIFAPDATIHDKDNTPEDFPPPITRYNKLFAETDYRDAEHFDIEEKVIGAVAYFTSGSRGEYRVGSGDWMKYCNGSSGPGSTYCSPTDYGSDHWTLQKNSFGCWEITEFSFNAGHVPFPPQ